MTNTVTIPTPGQIEKGKGITAVTTLRNPLNIRFTRDEKRIIDVEAKRLGISRGMFIRWCAVQVARKLHERNGEGDVHA